MNQKDKSDIRSVQIIRIEGSKFIFDYDVFQKIIDNNERCKNLPVSVIIINGALRTGKSFFSNFVIRYLLLLEEIGSLYKSDIDQDLGEDITSNKILTDYFVSRRGSSIQTLGVWALNKIFIYDGKAVILMDTQGIFDQELNQAMTIALISLSTILSSYQIYNLDKRIQEDHLCNMAYFSAYSSLISNTNNTKIGQTLCLLVRDWQNFENNFDLEKCDKETENYKREFLCDSKTLDSVKIETRKKIFDTYDNVIVKLCPHPGHIVTEGQFTGDISEIREDFRIHIKHIVKDIFENLKPKRISKSQSLLCRELPKYMKEYVMLYENVKESLPKAMTILETTEKICQENAKTKTLYFYKDKMMSKIKNQSMNKNDIDIWHNSCMKESIKYFNRLYIMGNDTEISKIRSVITTQIEKEYQQFLLMANERNVIFTIIKTLFDFIKNFSFRFDVLNEIFLKNVLFILFIFYFASGLLPFGSELLATIIKYMMCIFGGALISLNMKDDLKLKSKVSSNANDFDEINLNNNLSDD